MDGCIGDEGGGVGVGVGGMMARGGGRQKKMLMNALGTSEGSGRGKVILIKCMRADRVESNIDKMHEG